MGIKQKKIDELVISNDGRLIVLYKDAEYDVFTIQETKKVFEILKKKYGNKTRKN